MSPPLIIRSPRFSLLLQMRIKSYLKDTFSTRYRLYEEDTIYCTRRLYRAKRSCPNSPSRVHMSFSTNLFENEADCDEFEKYLSFFYGTHFYTSIFEYLNSYISNSLLSLLSFLHHEQFTADEYVHPLFTLILLFKFEMFRHQQT